MYIKAVFIFQSGSDKLKKYIFLLDMEEADGTFSCYFIVGLFLVANRWQQMATNPFESCYCSQGGMRSS